MEEYLSEKEQWEWVKSQVRENGPVVVLAIGVAAAGVFGWRWWQSHLDAARLEAGARYSQLVQQWERGDRSQGLVLLGGLERDHPGSPYTDQARLLAARMYVEGAELDKAAGELTTVMQQSKDPDLALVARLRLARVQIAQGKPDGAIATLNAVKPGSFTARFAETRGDAYFAKGDRAAALNEYRSAQAANLGSDAALLGLKIADLTTDTPPAPAAQTTPSAPGK